ncbi:MAG: glycosyltransferase family 39 protein, partial [Elusimicrobia bacterium]|nr:glycosyltransferase family 39 protein [Elusimicrobiota bacterium]
MRRTFPGVLWLAFAAALGMRAYEAAARPVVLAPQAPAEFELIARSLSLGGGFSYDGQTPTAFRLPGYPMALAAAGLLTGRPESRLPVFLLNFLASLAMVFVVYRLGLRLLPSPWAAAAAALAGLNPELAELDFRATAEGLFALEFALAALCAVRVLEEPGRWTRWAACGLALGLSLVTRSTLLA